jgi:hypothetical protein
MSNPAGLYRVNQRLADWFLANYFLKGFAAVFSG